MSGFLVKFSGVLLLRKRFGVCGRYECRRWKGAHEADGTTGGGATRGGMGNMMRNGKAADENAGDRRDNQRRRDSNRRKVQEEEEVDARGGKLKLTTK